MAVKSYRLYCTDCGNETVVAGADWRRDTNWKVKSLAQNDGQCPQCNPAVSIEHDTDLDADEIEQSIDLRGIDGVGETAASNLEQKGFDTVNAIEETPDERLLDVSWVGQGVLNKIEQQIDSLD